MSFSVSLKRFNSFQPVTAESMKQFNYFCHDYESVWLDVHYGYLFMILIPITIMLFLLYPYTMMILMFCRSYFFGYEQPDDDEELNNQQGSYSTLANDFIKILIIEIQLTFIYCVATLVSTCTPEL